MNTYEIIEELKMPYNDLLMYLLHIIRRSSMRLFPEFGMQINE